MNQPNIPAERGANERRLLVLLFYDTVCHLFLVLSNQKQYKVEVSA
jgi:hypothetical protein